MGQGEPLRVLVGSSDACNMRAAAEWRQILELSHEWHGPDYQSCGLLPSRAVSRKLALQAEPGLDQALLPGVSR